MKKSWDIYYGKHSGTVSYDTDDGHVIVNFPHKEKRRIVLQYLTSPKTFRVTTGQGVDEFDEVTTPPSASLEKMQLALSGLFGYCQVSVRWG